MSDDATAMRTLVHLIVDEAVGRCIELLLDEISAGRLSYATVKDGLLGYPDFEDAFAEIVDRKDSLMSDTELDLEALRRQLTDRIASRFESEGEAWSDERSGDRLASIAARVAFDTKHYRSNAALEAELSALREFEAGVRAAVDKHRAWEASEKPWMGGPSVNVDSMDDLLATLTAQREGRA